MTNTIRIYKEGKNFIIHLPYSPDRVRKIRTIPNRKWDSKRKVWIVADTDDLLAKLKTLFPVDTIEIKPSPSFVPASDSGIETQYNLCVVIE